MSLNWLSHSWGQVQLIITYGKSDQVYEQGWSVSDPELKAIERDASGTITQYEFGMKLFCKVGTTGANPHLGECSVNVEVCYKPLPQPPH